MHENGKHPIQNSVNTGKEKRERNKWRLGTKNFPTHTAFKGFLPCVNPLMPREPASLAKGFPTLTALIGLVSSVNLLMLRKR